MTTTVRSKNNYAANGGFGFSRLLAEFDRMSSGSVHSKADDASNYSLTSTESTSSIDSKTGINKVARKVTFYPKVTVYPSREKVITVEDRKRRWITKNDLDAIKDDIRSTANQVLEHHELRGMMDRLHFLIRKKGFYYTVDVDDDDDHMSSSTEGELVAVGGACRGMCENELARLLIDSETRGVERMIFARLDVSKGNLRPVTRHSKAVMQTQASARHVPRDERAQYIASQCKTGASAKWAHILGRADADAVTRAFMLQI